jgi:hypothetical protein
MKPSTSCYQLPLTLEAFEKVLALDETLVGTEDYMGVAYWWDFEYKYFLRDATHTERKKAHDTILAAGLPLDGESVEHDQIIAWATNNGRRARHLAGVTWTPYDGPRTWKRLTPNEETT